MSIIYFKQYIIYLATTKKFNTDARITKMTDAPLASHFTLCRLLSMRTFLLLLSPPADTPPFLSTWYRWQCPGSVTWGRCSLWLHSSTGSLSSAGGPCACSPDAPRAPDCLTHMAPPHPRTRPMATALRWAVWTHPPPRATKKTTSSKRLQMDKKGGNEVL